MLKKVIDGKPVIIKSSSKNIPSMNLIRNVYRKIPDDKRIPIVFQTKTQYLKEYIKNQEQSKGIDFSPAQERAYMSKELKGMRNVVSRYTTKKNPYIDLRTVFFTDKKITPKQFEASAFHEYAHEAWEKNPKIRKDWRTVNRTTAPTPYGRTDRQEDYAESYMQYRMGDLRDPKRIQLLKDHHSRNGENWDAVIKDMTHKREAIRKRGKARCKKCGKIMNLPLGYADYCYDCTPDTDTHSHNMPIVKKTTVPVIDYPEEYNTVKKKYIVKMPPQKYFETLQKAFEQRDIERGRPRKKETIEEFKQGLGGLYEEDIKKKIQQLREGKEIPTGYILTSKVDNKLNVEFDVPAGIEAAHRLGMKEVPVILAEGRSMTSKPGSFFGKWEYSPTELRNREDEESRTIASIRDVSDGVKVIDTKRLKRGATPGSTYEQDYEDNPKETWKEVLTVDTIPGEFNPTKDVSEDRRVFHKSIKVYKTDNTPFIKKAITFWKDKPLPTAPPDTPQESWLNEQQAMMRDTYGMSREKLTTHGKWMKIHWGGPDTEAQATRLAHTPYNELAKGIILDDLREFDVNNDGVINDTDMEILRRKQ